MRKKLFESYGIAYLPDYTMSLVNLSILYIQGMPNKPLSIYYAKECILVSQHLFEEIPLLPGDPALH